DETTRKLLPERAIQDKRDYTRLSALGELAEKWPDETTLRLLEAQVGLLEADWIRSRIQETIEPLREKLEAAQSQSG
ncbi:MAG: hypothetical protein HQ567_18325, partial [Candidatus Nealsonbacteria bacterium]|nr:hypothetical protein [Candidatus Nealsonbacteria bacterium]